MIRKPAQRTLEVSAIIPNIHMLVERTNLPRVLPIKRAPDVTTEDAIKAIVIAQKMKKKDSPNPEGTFTPTTPFLRRQPDQKSDSQASFSNIFAIPSS